MDKESGIISFYQKFATEQACRDYLEESRWKGRPCCPRCGSLGVTKFADGKLWKCNDCNRQFTVRIGTIFEESRLPLQKWFLAVFLATSLKKGISSLQLSRYLDITQKSAWFMLQRIRHTLERKTNDPGGPDIIEVDETYLGGKSRNKKKGRGAGNKTIIVGAASRYSRKIVTSIVERSDKESLIGFVEDVVDPDSIVITDDLNSYRSLTDKGYRHAIINHSANSYAVGSIYTNTIEGFWSHLKRGIKGIYHQVSRKHLQKYICEYTYRFGTREMNDLERFTDFLSLNQNVRLQYKFLIK